MPEFARDFPSRRYPLPRTASLSPEGFESIQAPPPPLAPGAIYRCVRGVDPLPGIRMSAAKIQTHLRDPFAELLLKRGIFPLSLRELLARLDEHNDAAEGLPEQKSFLVADGGKIHWTAATQELNRFFRLAVGRARNDDYRILISSSVALDSTDSQAFLQVIGWDATNQVYNYYERLQGVWIWAGNSWHALDPASRGQGPFDSHVNGSLVMKELKLPWNHWHSESSAINPDALAPLDPLREEPLFLNRQGAQFLQVSIVQPGIDRWTAARLARDSAAGQLDAPAWLRHLLTTTTVNLGSADMPSRQVAAGSKLRLPVSFFLNSDAFFDRLGIVPDVSHIQVLGQIYQNALQHFGVELRQGTFRQPGDTHFAFLVPEVAYEDLAALDQLLETKIVSPRLAACLLMVDFPNPVYSPRREQLMQHAPAVARRSGGAWDLETSFVGAIQAAAASLPTDSPEQEFLRYWGFGNSTWQAQLANVIEDYFAAVQARADVEAGFFEIFQLAESRRRRFGKQPLAEFDLTLPVTNIPEASSPLFMHVDGSITT